MLINVLNVSASLHVQTKTRPNADGTRGLAIYSMKEMHV